MFYRYFKQIFCSMFHRKYSWRRCLAFSSISSVTTAVTWYSMFYPIKLYHISSTETTTAKTPFNRNIDFPLLFALQLQLDCTISFINQLLKEFQTLLINMEHLSVEYGQLQSAYNDIANNNNEEIDELLLEVRSQWSMLTQKLDNAEIVIRSAMNTLRNSLETAFLCEEYLKTATTTTAPSSMPNESISTTGQSGLHFYHIEKEFISLVEKRKEIFRLWTSQTAEHIKQFGKS
ncbi:unnamed protein product [Trichobilharzia szidati]|nr:unnamed protein product [Trichobilharzia szidati]